MNLTNILCDKDKGIDITLPIIAEYVIRNILENSVEYDEDSIIALRKTFEDLRLEGVIHPVDVIAIELELIRHVLTMKYDPSIPEDLKIPLNKNITTCIDIFRKEILLLSDIHIVDMIGDSFILNEFRKTGLVDTLTTCESSEITSIIVDLMGSNIQDYRNAQRLHESETSAVLN